jgi:hypothetical protein
MAIVPITIAAKMKRTAVNAIGEISFAIIEPSENDPATSTEKPNIAR